MDSSAAFDPVAFRDALPAAMLVERRWLLHDGRKIPHYVDGSPRCGSLDGPDDTARLASFEDAVTAANARPGFGIGFALGDGWQGIDLDRHRDPDTGKLSPLADRIVSECTAYTEISPSGRGVHILGRGEAFDAIGASATEHRIEAYAGGRYFTVTGHALCFPGELADLRPVVERLRNRIVRVNGASRGDDHGGDNELVGEGRRNAYLTREAGKLRRIGLSPAAILASLKVINSERCDPPLDDDEIATIARSIGKYETDAKPEPTATLGTIYTAATLLATPATPTRWLVDGWMSEGASVLIGAHGGTDKSWFALQVAACLAAGRPFLGLTCERRRVLVYAAEDRADVLRWRLRYIVQALQIDPATLGDELMLIDQSRLPAELVGRDRFGVFAFAPLYAELERKMRERRADVLIIDSASDAFGGNEIARAEVRRYISETQRLAPYDGAVVHVVHVDKAHARGQANGQGYSGSTAWHNSVRQRWETRATRRRHR